MPFKNAAPLSVAGLCKDYPGFQLKNVSFQLEKGTVTGFIGRNGAGKTTTINAILGFVKPSAGEVLFSGLPLSDHAGQIKQRIGFVSAGMSYYTQKKLKTITRVAASFYPQWDGAAYRRRMAEFGLDENKTPASLSNGMKIKYALALALSHGADLLLLDEPTSGLDPVSREELIEIFLSLRNEGKTVLFSTHITSDLEKCADRIIFLRRGQISQDQPYRDFAAAYRLVTVEGKVPDELKRIALGICPVRDGATVLIHRENGEAAGRVPTLDEVMIHLEKEGEA